MLSRKRKRLQRKDFQRCNQGHNFKRGGRWLTGRRGSERNRIFSGLVFRVKTALQNFAVLIVSGFSAGEPVIGNRDDSKEKTKKATQRGQPAEHAMPLG